MTATARVAKKNSILKQWEYDAEQLLNEAETNSHDLEKKVRRLKVLIDTFNQNLHWWKNDVDPAELHQAELIEKRIKSKISSSEIALKHGKKIMDK